MSFLTPEELSSGAATQHAEWNVTEYDSTTSPRHDGDDSRANGCRPLGATHTDRLHRTEATPCG